jgi:hypothetical protein
MSLPIQYAAKLANNELQMLAEAGYGYCVAIAWGKLH